MRTSYLCFTVTKAEAQRDEMVCPVISKINYIPCCLLKQFTEHMTNAATIDVLGC